VSLRGTARIQESDPLGNRDQSVSNVLDVATDFFRSRKYRFLLEVHVDGRAPYTVDGTWKVPAKAEQFGPLRSGGSILPPGVELPVDVADDDPSDVDIDWDAYVAIPGRKKTQKKLYEEYRAAKTAAYVESERRKRGEPAAAPPAEPAPASGDHAAILEVQRIYALGVSGSATVISSQDTGRNVSGVPIWRFELELDSGRRVTIEQAVPKRAMKRYADGSQVAVHTDPDDENAVVLG
jgi:hypothetical protein